MKRKKIESRKVTTDWSKVDLTELEEICMNMLKEFPPEVAKKIIVRILWDYSDIAMDEMVQQSSAFFPKYLPDEPAVTR